MKNNSHQSRANAAAAAQSDHLLEQQQQFSMTFEVFIMELTVPSWFHAEDKKHRTLQKNNISNAIRLSGIFHFICDIVPRDEINEEDMAHKTARGGSSGQDNTDG
ncbi:nuclear transcription factor Y subunit C-4-like [Capsicum chacoense]